MKKISISFGTRPEAIKLSPIVLAMREHPALHCRVCVTARHRETLDQVPGVFGIVPDVDGRSTGRVLEACARFLGVAGSPA